MVSSEGAGVSGANQPLLPEGEGSGSVWKSSEVVGIWLAAPQVCLRLKLDQKV